MKSIMMTCPSSKAVMTGCVLDCEIRMGQETKRPAVIVCPGGGYLYCSPREGEPVAMAYAARGMHAFVLEYSVKWECKGFRPHKDLAWAIRTVREHAEEWNVNPEEIVVVGFSAGGHLALSSAVMGEDRPNALVLGYPLGAMHGKMSSFMLKMMTGKDEWTQEEEDSFDLVTQIDATTAPAFIWGTVEDALTKSGALAIANAYSMHDRPYELHLYQFGPHGYALAEAESADGSSQVLDERVAEWVDLSTGWIRRLFGGLVFEDRSTSKMMGIMKEMGLLPEGVKGIGNA